jgi:hypothetical protein
MRGLHSILGMVFVALLGWGTAGFRLLCPYDDFDKVLPHRWIGTDANANNACVETSHQRRGNDIRKHIGRPLKREVSVSLANDCDAHEPRCLTGDEARQVCGLHWVLAAAHCRLRLGRGSPPRLHGNPGNPIPKYSFFLGTNEHFELDECSMNTGKRDVQRPQQVPIREHHGRALSWSRAGWRKHPNRCGADSRVRHHMKGRLSWRPLSIASARVAPRRQSQRPYPHGS